MLPRITSLADFFKKAESDDAYKDAACRAYEGFFDYVPTWPVVKKMIEQWARENVGKDLVNPDCGRMVEYLNTFIDDPTYHHR